MTQYDPIQLLRPALDAGAFGCKDKNRLSTDLLTTIKHIEELNKAYR